MFRGPATRSDGRAATLHVEAPRISDTRSLSDTSIVVRRREAAALTLSLVGNHDQDTDAETFLRIGWGELPHCDKMVVDFRSTKQLGADVVNALVELVVEARTQGVAFQVASRRGTYAHDVLELLGIIDRLDWTDRLPEPAQA
jgi:excinuclease UvrABC ATPase subunit